MDVRDIGEIIATRKLRLLGEKEREVTVLIGKPKQLPDSESYYCPLQIAGIGSEKILCAYGVDAVQAIQLAMEQIGIRLYASKEAKAGQLRWLSEEEDDLGFPVPL
jgi:hypothetical protein